jgi:hypothetical protein
MANIAFSSWINAWTIEKALKSLGRDLSVTQDRGLVRQVVAAPTPGDTLFFTQEDSMSQFLGRDDLQFQPRDLPTPGRDDKLVFAEFAEDLGVPSVSSQPIGGSEEEPDRKILLKARHSWRKGRQLPRGWICESSLDFLNAFKEIEEQGFQRDFFFLQDWLELHPMDNYSVCGYHDAIRPERNLIAVVQRVASYSGGQSCSAAVAVVEDPDRLIAHACRILNALEFIGPYEMEFVRTGDGFKVLELNPRFWLQHGIFLQPGNGLIRRYLSLENGGSPDGETRDTGVWVDGIWYLHSLLKCRLSVFSVARKTSRLGRSRLQFFPSLPVSARYLLAKVFSRQPLPRRNNRFQ